MATLIRLTNTPSDNFFAEMLLKGIGASFGGSGSTAAGAGVVRRQMASSFGIHPRLDDGSGLSRATGTSPRQVVTLLRMMASDSAFTNSLAVAGETGTMRYEDQGTAAAGNCRGKTGTLHDVANLVGYCTAQDGAPARVRVPDELGRPGHRPRDRGSDGGHAGEVRRLSPAPASSTCLRFSQ